MLVFHSAPAGTKWLRCNSLVDCIRVNRGYIRLPDLLIQLRNIVGFRYGALAELRFVPTLVSMYVFYLAGKDSQSEAVGILSCA